MRRLFVLSILVLLCAAPAFAQQKDPIPVFVFDARGAFALLKADAVTAETLGVTVADLPGHGLGVVGGLHFYPLRRGGFALGVGGELLLSSASRQSIDVDGVTPLGPEVRRQLHSLSGQLSFNFGHRQGWSYISGGMGPTGFDTYLADTLPDGLQPMTINFGFGARWFNNDHVAFCLDLRFYQTQPADATLVVGGRERQSLMVISAGISLK
jgi:hypothetical protein